MTTTGRRLPQTSRKGKTIRSTTRTPITRRSRRASIIPYILHYTSPGDLILDPFCGSGMTGVAAQMCANPPANLLEQFPELKERVGPRHAILNDLSPAACHIAYNYNTPVDVDALRREFERIKAAVKDEFDWLYGTEHYEPAVGVYDPANADVASRLKNPPGGAMHMLLGGEERTWELLAKAEVEARLGYPVTELPRKQKWGDLDVAKVSSGSASRPRFNTPSGRTFTAVKALSPSRNPPVRSVREVRTRVSRSRRRSASLAGVATWLASGKRLMRLMMALSAHTAINDGRPNKQRGSKPSQTSLSSLSRE